MPESQPFVKIDQLSYAYRKNSRDWVLDRVEMEIPSGEFVLICGASGSGKSTLCRTFNGLIPHFYEGSLQGKIQIEGIPTSSLSVGGLFEQVGMIFQNPEAQLFNQTVMREIAFGLESLGLPRTEMEKRIEESADQVGIADLLERNPHELSGGEQHLVSIAAILAIAPQFIVLDEPYANLDPANVRRVRALLKRIHEQGMGVVISEHRLRYAVSDVMRMITLHQGNIVLDGAPGRILAHDVETYGLEAPLSVRLGKRLGMEALPLDVKALQAMNSSASYPPDLRPSFPESAGTDGRTVLEVDGVFFEQNGFPILRDIDFTVKQGESVAIVGANGAGKTSLLKHLNGLYRPSQGKVTVMGLDTSRTKISELARHVGMAFQNPGNQFFKFTVWDEVTVSARVLDTYDEEWLKTLIKLFRLEPLLNRAPYRLSGGEKKRVAFAAALSSKPAILALDEPTAGQDGYFRKELGDLLADLRSRGQTVLLITHDLSFAEQHAHRWLLMSRGRILSEGSPWQVMADEDAMRRANLEPTDAFRLYFEP
jgi:energy-coupling factor transport system ATP-binding protein